MTRTTFATVRTPTGPVGASPWWNPQRASSMPSFRYADVHARVDIPLVERDWPARRLAAAPLWVPVDLRDGNQALAEPMDPGRKRLFFDLMLAMGYKEIEVGYPSASKTDFDFVRELATVGAVPADVTIVVFTPARRDLIERTLASVHGLTTPVVVHMYAATAPVWRDTVLGKDRAALRELIVAGGRDVLEFARDAPHIRFEFSPEVFNLTEPDYVLEICDTMTTLWGATPDRPVILNLPATVEVATPNVYADQIEYMHKNLSRRDSVILSVHPHNDRGTGIACAELAVLAGAQRVEGCLFGNGERTGNVDIATLALNLHAQGIDPMIDFSDIDEVRRVVEHCTRLEVPPRHPYVGDLVHTAFSGTHQDAIKKGFAEHRARSLATGIDERELPWRVPYLPVDPADLGRAYDAVIRVNSQSGKGGIAYLLESAYGVELPRRLQIDLARHVQAHTDATGAEVTAGDVWRIFETLYLAPVRTGVDLARVDVVGEAVDIVLRVDGTEVRTHHAGLEPVEALREAVRAHGLDVDVVSIHQTATGTGEGAEALTLVQHRIGGHPHWVGARHRSALTATVTAVLKAASGASARDAHEEGAV